MKKVNINFEGTRRRLQSPPSSAAQSYPGSRLYGLCCSVDLGCSSSPGSAAPKGQLLTWPPSSRSPCLPSARSGASGGSSLTILLLVAPPVPLHRITAQRGRICLPARSFLRLNSPLPQASPPVVRD